MFFRPCFSTLVELCGRTGGEIGYIMYGMNAWHAQIKRMNERMNEKKNYRINEWQICKNKNNAWMNERTNQRTYERMKGWMNECMICTKNECSMHAQVKWMNEWTCEDRPLWSEINYIVEQSHILPRKPPIYTDEQQSIPSSLCTCI